MSIHQPTVTSTLKKPDYNFELRVIAYRPLSKSELCSVLKLWMRQTRRKTIPKNKIITYQTIIGFDD